MFWLRNDKFDSNYVFLSRGMLYIISSSSLLSKDINGIIIYRTVDVIVFLF